jgi:hypothetical protein
LLLITLLLKTTKPLPLVALGAPLKAMAGRQAFEVTLALQ